MVFFLLFSTIVFSNKCIAQEQLKKELKSIYIEKNAKLRKDYYKVIYKFNYHNQYPELEKACVKMLFNSDCTTLEEAMQRNLDTFDKIIEPDNSKTSLTNIYELAFLNGVEGRYLCYFAISNRMVSVGQKVVRNTKTRNFVYDIKRAKVLELTDIFVPAKVNEIKAFIGDKSPQINIDDKSIVIGYKVNGKMNEMELDYVSHVNAFTPEFKQLVEWEKVMRNKQQQYISQQVLGANRIVKQSEKFHNTNQWQVITGIKVFDVVEQMPEFPGGAAALMSWLSRNIRYPAIAEENGIQGRVVCTFVVERDGSITDIQVARSVDPSLDKEAIRVLKLMPKWSPGRQNGAPVRVKYTVPVTFRLIVDNTPKKLIRR